MIKIYTFLHFLVIYGSEEIVGKFVNVLLLHNNAEDGKIERWGSEVTCKGAKKKRTVPGGRPKNRRNKGKIRNK